jgi:hypothetical protein
MANKGLALIFGGGPKGKDGGKPSIEPDENDEPMDDEGDDEEIRKIAAKILEAVKGDDEDMLVEALNDWRECDERWDRESDKDEEY